AGAGGGREAARRSREGRRRPVVEPFIACDHCEGAHAHMMKKRVHVPAGRRDAVERMAFQELAAQLYAEAVRPADVGAREDLASVREGRRHVGFASRVAHTNDEGTVIALNPHRFIDAAAAVRAADVVRLAEARFNEEPRDACGEYRAALEIIVREGKVAVVANKGRADEAAIAVIAA